MGFFCWWFVVVEDDGGLVFGGMGLLLLDWEV